ncbi:hypothetical protein BDR04DRAFT_118797 [Suillus decipiens]|nr:hypothetical protein BDR04DRAFT_118797 [Suillus decipiens]
MAERWRQNHAGLQLMRTNMERFNLHIILSSSVARTRPPLTPHSFAAQALSRPQSAPSSSDAPSQSAVWRVPCASHIIHLFDQPVGQTTKTVFTDVSSQRSILTLKPVYSFSAACSAFAEDKSRNSPRISSCSLTLVRHRLVVNVKGDLAETQLILPACTFEKYWPLVGWGSVQCGTVLELD